MKSAEAVSSAEVAAALDEFIAAAVDAAGGDTSPIRTLARIPFHWPPHPISSDYHVLASDWTGRATFEAHGDAFDVSVARTALGIFGRCEQFWNDAKGDTEEEMLANLKKSCEPLFERQFAIGRTMGLSGRFDGFVQTLDPISLVKLLYCIDRDVANDAQIEIETHASTGLFSEALVRILRDSQHQNRRSAQWCVLDMFEDLPSFCSTQQQQSQAIDAIGKLMWDANDDYARTIYKAGVVLGGHICTEPAASTLLSCIAAPSKIGRRSAIHAVFHLSEWMPQLKGGIVTKLRNAAATDEEPSLREFAARMARDIDSSANEHVTEPMFDDET